MIDFINVLTLFTLLILSWLLIGFVSLSIISHKFENFSLGRNITLAILIGWPFVLLGFILSKIFINKKNRNIKSRKDLQEKMELLQESGMIDQEAIFEAIDENKKN